MNFVNLKAQRTSMDRFEKKNYFLSLALQTSQTVLSATYVLTCPHFSNFYIFSKRFQRDFHIVSHALVFAETDAGSAYSLHIGRSFARQFAG